MGKAKKQLSLDSEKLIIKEKSDVPDQYHASELQAFEALRRRGIAMCFADMISWEAHERYLQQLTSHLRADPPQNYLRPTLQQVLKADRQVFLYLVRIGVDLKRLPNNTLDLDTKIFEALHSYEVGFHVLPLPKTAVRTDTPKQSDLLWSCAWWQRQPMAVPAPSTLQGQGASVWGKGQKQRRPRSLAQIPPWEGQRQHGSAWTKTLLQLPGREVF